MIIENKGKQEQGLGLLAKHLDLFIVQRLTDGDGVAIRPEEWEPPPPRERRGWDSLNDALQTLHILLLLLADADHPLHVHVHGRGEGWDGADGSSLLLRIRIKVLNLRL
jgi:hypothetical protein